MKSHTILIADDDALLVKTLENAFIEENYHVYTANNGIDALQQFYDCKPKIILMDIDMPGKNGWEALKQIRQDNRLIPIIIMTGQFINEADAIKSLNDGAVSFIRKSLSYKEIVATVNSSFRSAYSPDEIFSFGKFTLNMSSHYLQIGNEKYPLTNREAQLLCLLVKNINQTVEMKKILHFVWSHDSSSNNQMMRNTIAKLNRMFEKFGKIHIKSIYGVGYSLQIQ